MTTTDIHDSAVLKLNIAKLSEETCLSIYTYIRTNGSIQVL